MLFTETHVTGNNTLILIKTQNLLIFIKLLEVISFIHLLTDPFCNKRRFVTVLNDCCFPYMGTNAVD